MGFMKWFITNGCRFGLSFAYKVVRHNWELLRDSGPLVVYANHTGIIEAPIFYTQLQPRPITGLGKAEIWDNRFLSFVFKLWGIIPIHRGESDMDALRKCIGALKAGKMLGMAPEGTRSKTGKLLRAKPGVVFMALQANSPLQPVAHWGGMKDPPGSKRRGRKVFHINVGRAFYLDAHGARVNQEVRQAMADEMMYQVAKLLPEDMRGEYADLSKATENYLRFID
jgi:1-acyl-sn-glycerol-3-phosphate acyltransferase